MVPYSTPEVRPLSEQERELLLNLLRTNAPDRLGELDCLSVIARCGCGQCPGIIFAPGLDDQPIVAKPYLVADMITTDQPDAPIGVMLWGTESRLIELEFCNYGDSGATELPAFANLKQFTAA